MKKIILSLFALSTLASCQKSLEVVGGMSESSLEVSFTSAITTRAIGTQWEASDQIGVFMYETGLTDLYPIGNNSNVLYYISEDEGSEGSRFSSDDPLRFPQDQNVDFMAYYPYMEEVGELSATTIGSIEQSSAEALKSLDIMVARTTNCSYNSSPTLSFDRKMSKIIFTIIRKETAEEAELTNFTLSNVASNGSFTIYNSSNIAISAGSETEPISLFMNDIEQVEAIIVPQSVAEAKISLSVAGKIYSGLFSESFEEGMQYNYDLYIGGDEVTISEGTITDWDEVAGGEMETEQITMLYTPYSAAEISASNVPEEYTWYITDEGEITAELMSGVIEALEVADEEGRKISIIMPFATSIGESAFECCYTIASIELPIASVIGEGAFYECISLATIKLPEAISIEYYAFGYCSSLTTIELPKATYIGDCVFYGCDNLTTIELPEAISIELYAFSECPLTYVELPKATSIGEGSFLYCSSLATVKLPNVISMESCAFEGCTNLTTIELPEVTSIGRSAFSDCTSLTTIEFPEATSMGGFAFASCTKLTTVELPKATSLEYYLFYQCTALTTIKLTAESEITCEEEQLCDANDPSNITLYISKINANVANLTDGTYTFKEIIYID